LKLLRRAVELPRKF